MTCMENCADTNNNLILNKLPEDERQAIPLGYNNQFLLSLSIHISQREEEAEGKIQGESTGSKNHCGCLQSLLTFFFLLLLFSQYVFCFWSVCFIFFLILLFTQLCFTYHCEIYMSASGCIFS